jgi:histone H3/H4
MTWKQDTKVKTKTKYVYKYPVSEMTFSPWTLKRIMSEETGMRISMRSVMSMEAILSNAIRVVMKVAKLQALESPHPKTIKKDDIDVGLMVLRMNMRNTPLGETT